MTMIDKQMRDERRREQGDGVKALEASGALDDLYAKIDAGDIQLEGKDGLERGLQAELTGHLGYEKGDPEAGLHPNSRNGSSAKTVATSVGDVELAIPRDRDGSFTPVLVPKGSRRVGGLDDMIVSLYAGGMTVRDIEHHLVSTVGTEISQETISRIHRRGLRRGAGLAAAAAGGVLLGDLPGRDHREGPRRCARAQQGRAHCRRCRYGRDQVRPGHLDPSR